MRRIVLFTVFSFYCCTFSQTMWQPNEFNPIIRNYFDPDSDCMFRPCIVYHDREYHMWYSKGNSESEQMIGYAKSLDGIQWTLISDKVIAPSKDLNRFDTYQASQGWVLVDQDTFKMWYRGKGLDLDTFGMAWSLDGIHWSKVKGSCSNGSVYDRFSDGSHALGVLTPCVVKLDSIYHMWYSRYIAAPFLCVIAYARSSDGVHWKNIPGSERGGAVLDWGDKNSFDEGSVSYPCVVKTEQGLYMWYVGIDKSGAMRVGLASSSDGIEWTRVSGCGDKGACLNEANFPCVLLQGNIFKMWYGINNKDIINYAISNWITKISAMTPAKPGKDVIVEQNFPNPCNNTTFISYRLMTCRHVDISLYDIRGCHIKTLVDDIHQAGNYCYRFDGTNLCSGIYYYICNVEGKIHCRKMMVVK